MDLYASDENVASLEADLARNETPVIATEVAWHLRQRDTPRALKLATRVELALDGATEPLRPRLILTRAECLLLQFRIDESRAELARLAALGREAGPAAHGDAALLEAALANVEGNPREEFASVARAKAAYEEAADARRAAFAVAAELVSSSRDYQQAARDEIARLRETWNDPALAAQLDYTSGILEFIAGHFGASIELLTPAAEHAHRAGAAEMGLRSLLTIGSCLSNLGEREESAKVAEKALARARAFGWPRWIGAALAHLGRIFTYMDQPEKAIEVLEESRRIFSVQPQSRYHAMVLFYLGDAFLHAGDAARALEMLDQSEAIVRNLGLPPETSANLAISARAKARLGRHDEALANANDALAMSRSCGAKLWESEALRSLAQIHLESAPREALRHLESALEVSTALGGHHEKSLLWVEIARVHERSGDLAAALAAERTARTEQLAEQNRRASNQAVVSRMKHEMEALALREAEMRRLASVDPLTGLANRRHFFSLAEAEVSRARRYGGPVALIMGDIDKFKRINDTRGHPAGDAVLTAVALCLESEARPNDTVARLGGEEFAVLLPGADAASALAVAERLRARVEGLELAWEGARVPVTISLGCASSVPGANDPQSPLAFFESMVRSADEALYAAKAAGRNRCIASA
jgi:diguanylate cyclase (GGDEF)-like protein